MQRGINRLGACSINIKRNGVDVSMSPVETVSTSVGVNGLTAILVLLACIAISWWSLQNLKLDLVIRHPKSPQGKLLQLLLAIVLGRLVADFVMEYWGYTQMLKYMF